MPVGFDNTDLMDLTRQMPSRVTFKTESVQEFEPNKTPGGMAVPKLKDGIPCFKDVDFVTVRQPSDVNSVVFEAERWITEIVPMEVSNGRLSQQNAEKYKLAYDHFKKGKDAPPEGTPLKMWPGILPAQLDRLTYMDVRTVEELANLADDAVHRYGMGGVDLKQRAKAWLANANDKVQNLQKQNDALMASMTKMQEQLDALTKDKKK